MILFKHVAIVYKPTRQCLALAQGFFKELKEQGFIVDTVWVDEVKQGDLDTYDLVLSIGGDGTLLKISWSLLDRSPLILPIPCGRRTVYYEDLDIRDIHSIVEKILDGRFCIDILKRICLSFSSKKYFALNEVAMINQHLGRVLTINVEISTPYNKSRFYIEGDGLIVATASGSSAYVLSAGASVIEPKITGIYLAPLNPMNMNIAPIFLHSFTRIRVTPRGYTNVFVDGIYVGTISPGNSVECMLSNNNIRLVRLSCRGDVVRSIFASRTTLFK